MVGLLDTGDVWWIGVYDRENLRETAALAEQVPAGRGWFYRWDPGLLKPVFFRDLQETEQEDSVLDILRQVATGIEEPARAETRIRALIR